MANVEIIHGLRHAVKDAEKAVREANARLADLRRDLAFEEERCSHSWGEAEYVPEHIEGYYSPGDPEGTMGVDRQLPMSVPSRTIPKWKRTCNVCGKVEITDRTKTVTTEKPAW